MSLPTRKNILALLIVDESMYPDPTPKFPNPYNTPIHEIDSNKENPVSWQIKELGFDVTVRWLYRMDFDFMSNNDDLKEDLKTKDPPFAAVTIALKSGHSLAAVRLIEVINGIGATEAPTPKVVIASTWVEMKQQLLTMFPEHAHMEV